MRKTFTKMDKPLLIAIIIFFVFGLIMIQSASSMESYMRYGNSPYIYFFKQLVFYVGGIILFLFIIFFPTKNYFKLAKIGMFSLIGALLLLKAYGTISNNALSWFDLGFFSIQPSELAKIVIIVYLGTYYDLHKDELDNQWVLIKPLLLIGIIFSLILLQPDLGTASIIFLLTCIIFYAIPMKNEYRQIINKLIIGGVGIIAAVLITTGGSFLHDYQKERFNFLAPCQRYTEDSGYQVCNSFIALNSGGLVGKGIGQSTQKYLYLPEAYTDFIYSIIVEEWGLWMGILIILTYLFILYRILKIARNALNLKNSIIAYGVSVYIFLHIFVNISGVLGLIPLTGVPLPFLSYGGSFALSLMAALALVQRVQIENNNIKK